MVSSTSVWFYYTFILFNTKIYPNNIEEMNNNKFNKHATCRVWQHDERLFRGWKLSFANPSTLVFFFLLKRYHITFENI